MGLLRIVIDRDVLRSNFREVRSALAPSVAIGAVVKSQAYGHGMVECARIFSQEGARFLVVSLLDEGIKLRDEGFGEDILLIGGIWPQEAQECVEHGLIPVVSGLEVLGALSEVGQKIQKRVSVHIKVDTGMGRLGVPLDEWGRFADIACSLPAICVEGLMSHFSVADSLEQSDVAYTARQIELFRQVVKEARERFSHLRWIHLANSAGVVNLPASHWNLVRPGLSLYGGVCTPDLRLQEAMEVTSRILNVKRVPEGSFLSYGRAFRTTREALVAVVPVGYASGYLRSVSNKGEMLVRGERAPVVGRVCMDLTLVDVSHISHVEVGDEVILMGGRGKNRITVFEVSQWMDTIPYEVFCLLGGSHVASREYIN
jgi:alanine racemase